MIDNADIQAARHAIIELAERLNEIIHHATSDQYKNTHVEEMSDFVEINGKLEELGYGGDGK